MDWSDSKLLSLDLWDLKGRIIVIRLNNLLKKDSSLKQFLKHRYSYWNNSYKDVVRLIKLGYKEWPKCPTCGKYIKNIKHSHCSTKCSTLDPKVKDKLQTSMEKKYGVKNAYNIPKVRKKAEKSHKKAIIDKYGSWSEFSKKNQKKANITRKEKSEADPNYWKEIKEKEKITRQIKLLEDPDYNKKAKIKEIQTKKENGTLRSSKPENKIERFLIKKFGKDNVQHEYISDKYPFHCDFYIKSRDLYIECNFHWSHGDHWYNSNSNDFKKVKSWEKKNNKFYTASIKTWTERDVSKREVAKQNNLNYVVFWDPLDYLIWESFNYPDGKDWKKEFSWLPDRKLNLDKQLGYPKEIKASNCYLIAKKANWKEFYKRELELWSKNENYFQIKLYRNRLKYINKKPDKLTDLEILRGINISGVLRAYSIFDNDGFIKLIDKYKIDSVYDFCSGWGERLTTCALKDIKYLGIDINDKSVNGQKEILKNYNLNKQQIINSASENYIPKETYDLVFTCPPYMDYEVYTDKGAENLKGEEFFNWWKKSIQNAEKCNPKIIAYQINQKNKNKLNKVLIELGYIKIDQIDLRQKRSHFNKKDKIDFESIEIFKKNNKN